MRSLTGNQRMVLSWLETGPNLLATKISLAAAFWTLYRFRICSSGRPANSEFTWYRRNRTMAWTKVFTPWGVFFLFFSSAWMYKNAYLHTLLICRIQITHHLRFFTAGERWTIYEYGQIPTGTRHPNDVPCTYRGMYLSSYKRYDPCTSLGWTDLDKNSNISSTRNVYTKQGWTRSGFFTLRSDPDL